MYRAIWKPSGSVRLLNGGGASVCCAKAAIENNVRQTQSLLMVDIAELQCRTKLCWSQDWLALFDVGLAREEMVVSPGHDHLGDILREGQKLHDELMP